MPGNPSSPEKVSPGQAGPVAGGVESPEVGQRRGGLLFDVGHVDFSARIRNRDQIAEWNPHRGQMALLDSIVWKHAERCQGVGLKRVRDDEFWVPGHFPDRPMLPGVVMIEAGAQLACYLYISRKPKPSLVAFLRIENAAFRATVTPGEDLYLLCNDVKVGRRNFICDIQGLIGPGVENKIVFEARVSGMMI